MLRICASVELIMQDASGSRASVTVWAPASIDVSEIEASASALASIVVPLSGCVLVGQRVKYTTVQDTEIVPDGPNRTAHSLAVFFAVDEAASGAIVTVPGVKDSVFVASGPGAGAVLDLTNTDVSAFVSAVLDAGMTDPFGVPLLDVSGGYLQSRV